MNNLEILIAARAKLATPETWTQGAGAREHDGTPTLPEDPAATCFCTFGAVKALTTFPTVCSPAWSFLTSAAGMSPVQYNDTPGRTHAEILAMFDKAIEKAQASEVVNKKDQE